MLEKLLKEIQGGGSLEIRALAQKLGTTPMMIKGMLELLEKQGYIQPFQSCDTSCDGCGLKAVCQPGARSEELRLWQA